MLRLILRHFKKQIKIHIHIMLKWIKLVGVIMLPHSCPASEPFLGIGQVGRGLGPPTFSSYVYIRKSWLRYLFLSSPQAILARVKAKNPYQCVGGPFLNVFCKSLPEYIPPLNSLFDIDVPSKMYQISKYSILGALWALNTMNWGTNGGVYWNLNSS